MERIKKKNEIKNQFGVRIGQRDIDYLIQQAERAEERPRFRRYG
ncbi:hypothetical protein [Virgibacillus oceani]|nr:hypothetical protein [Virgibacillus oceani]